METNKHILAVRDVKTALMEMTSVKEDDYLRRKQLAKIYAPLIVDRIADVVMEKVEAQNYIKGRR